MSIYIKLIPILLFIVSYSYCEEEVIKDKYFVLYKYTPIYTPK